MHLNKKAFANSLALVTGFIYIVFYFLMVVAPSAFNFLWNAQFFGADLASLVSGITFGGFLVMLVTMMVFTWLVGWCWAHCYNWLVK